MSISNEQKKCIRERAMPLLVNQKKQDLMKEQATCIADCEAKAQAHLAANEAYQLDPSTDKKAAVISAFNEVKAARAQVELLGQQLSEVETPNSFFDIMLDNIDQLTGEGLDAWCASAEQAQLEAHIADGEAKLADAKAKLAEMKG